MLTTALTLYWYFYAIGLESGDDAAFSRVPEWTGSGIDWVVLGFGKLCYG